MHQALQTGQAAYVTYCYRASPGQEPSSTRRDRQLKDHQTSACLDRVKMSRRLSLEPCSRPKLSSQLRRRLRTLLSAIGRALPRPAQHPREPFPPTEQKGL
jgi:hypothetical protein